MYDGYNKDWQERPHKQKAEGTMEIIKHGKLLVGWGYLIVQGAVSSSERVSVTGHSLS
jgi:hypothetical protein